MQSIVKEELMITDYPEYYEFEDYKDYYDLNINLNDVVKMRKIENEIIKEEEIENKIIKTEKVENEIKNEEHYHKPIQQQTYIKEELMISYYESSNEESAPTEAPPTRPRSIPSTNSAPSILESARSWTHTCCSGCSQKSTVRVRQPRCRLCNELVSYHCERCTKSYKTFYDLNYHLRTYHTSENIVFRCPTCSSQLRTAKLLAAHTRYCERPKLLSCELCPYKTKFRASLRDHMKSVHTIRTFRCEKCGKVYRNCKSMRRHKKHYCGVEKMFRCEHCPFRAFRKDQLPAHFRQKHGHIFK